MTRITNVSIDECARDARKVAGEGMAWLHAFERMLSAYGWQIKEVGQVYFHPKAVILEDWDIQRRSAS